MDMWSVGCVLGELLSEKPLFPGTSTMNQLDRIIQWIGLPTADDIEAVKSPFATTMMESLSEIETNEISEMLPQASEDAKDLLSKLIMFNPTKRLTAEVWESDVTWGQTRRRGEGERRQKGEGERRARERKRGEDCLHFLFVSSKLCSIHIWPNSTTLKQSLCAQLPLRSPSVTTASTLSVSTATLSMLTLKKRRSKLKNRNTGERRKSEGKNIYHYNYNA